jgi:hypothetical protein
MALKDLRARAKKIGIRIDADRYDVAIERSVWGYWLVDEKTGEGPWADENYCSTQSELKGKLADLERERA